METSKILSADLLDLLFDERNKDYGAYQLRKTYNQRITKALVITFSLAGLIVTGSVLASSLKPNADPELVMSEVTISEIQPEEPEPLPEPERQPEPEQQVRTEQFTADIRLVEEDVDPPPTQDELQQAKIDVADNDGIDDDGKVKEPQQLDDGKGIIDVPKAKEPEIWEKVEIDAKFGGNWEKFLLKNLRGDVPVENGAPAGRHTVIIQFVVDVDGTVSDIKPLTNIGYGMETEAIRVIKRSDKWVPAFQNTKHVKAYRKQAIIFEVLTDE